MKIKIKIIGVLVSVFLLFMGGIVYYASTKLNPEEIRKVAITQVEKVFPKAKVSLGDISIKWGLNFKIQLHKFGINTIDSNGGSIEMMSVDDFVIKVPLWAVITNRGVIEIQLDKPLLSYVEFPIGNNWTFAMDEKKDEKKEEKVAEGKEETQEKVIGIFGKSKINLKLSNVMVKYHRRDNSKGEINISRFLVKGLNFESSTAFEIASDAKFIIADNSEVSFSTIAIGEINIADLIKNGSVSSLVIIKVNNILKTGLDWKFPEITTNVNLLLKKDGEISGKIQTSFESQNKIAADFKISKQVEVSNINIEIILKDIGLIMGVNQEIDLSKAKLTARGGLIYTEDKKIDADVSFSAAPGIGYSKDGIVATASIDGSFKQSDLAVRVKTDTLNGVVDTVINGEYDPNHKFDIKTLKPFDIKVTATRLKIPEKFIQKKLWEKSESPELEKVESKSSGVGTFEKEKPVPIPHFPAANINLAWSNINVGGEDFQGRGKIVVSSQAIAIDNMTFKFSKGTGKLTQTIKLGLKSNESAFDLGISDLNLSSFKSFLPPFVENFSGIFSGNINGNVTLYKSNKPPLYDVNVAVDAKNGEIKKLNISEYITPLLAKIPLAKDHLQDKQLKVDGNFETLNMKGRFTETTYTLSSFNFIGLSKQIEVTGEGIIYPSPLSSKNSTMDINFTENAKIGEILQKNIGTKVLPIRLSGPGYAMKPDMQYTLSKIAKGAAKTKGVEAAQKIIEKNIDKIVPEKAREKVKGLLNGLFKKNN